MAKFHLRTGLLLLALCGLTCGQTTNILGRAGTVTTYKGSVSGGRPCYFPFIYNGRVYSYCTTVDHSRAWCATTSDYDTDGLWGNCVNVSATAATRATNSNGVSVDCVFPFLYNGVEQTECIMGRGKPWCSTTYNYDTDRQQADCIIYQVKDIQTFGGNGGGKPCAFPFFYRGGFVFGCTSDLYDRNWCSTTDNYARDKEWGVCVEETAVMGTKLGNSGGQDCVFPFTYAGIVHQGCIPDDNPKLWCATTSDYDTDGLWGRCLLYPPEMLTVNGNSFGRPCVFPFLFENVNYYGCIVTSRSGNAWCGTQSNYDTTLAWGECVLTSDTVYTIRGNDGGQPCVFPFTYKGATYYNCIQQDTQDPWCATTSDYDTDSKWGFCYDYS